MAYVCSRCQQTVDKVIQLDNIERTWWSNRETRELWPQYDYLCVTCAIAVLNITEEDFIREERRLANDTDFHLNLTRGRLAQVLVESVFLEFGYEVYLFGYESYLTNIITHMRKGTANIPARKVRAMPDLFVYDREYNEGFFLEVKASSTRDEARYWLAKSTLDTYRVHWPEAVLVVYCIPTAHIFCQQISRIAMDNLKVEDSPTTGWPNYVINLERDWLTLPNQFRLLNQAKCDAYLGQLQNVIGAFKI